VNGQLGPQGLQQMQVDRAGDGVPWSEQQRRDNEQRRFIESMGSAVVGTNQTAANLLSTAKTRASQLRAEIADVEAKRAELAMLERMIAAAEVTP
jgi:hypothetical protein